MQRKDAGVTARRGRYEQMELYARFQPESPKDILEDTQVHKGE